MHNKKVKKEYSSDLKTIKIHLLLIAFSVLLLLLGVINIKFAVMGYLLLMFSTTVVLFAHIAQLLKK